jgi:hypothetical protein
VEAVYFEKQLLEVISIWKYSSDSYYSKCGPSNSSIDTSLELVGLAAQTFWIIFCNLARSLGDS